MLSKEKAISVLGNLPNGDAILENIIDANQQDTMATIEDRIEILNYEIEEEQDLIRKYEIDQEETEKDHTRNIKVCNQKIKDLKVQIKNLESQ